jgi:hypothetical protein
MEHGFHVGDGQRLSHVRVSSVFHPWLRIENNLLMTQNRRLL